MLNFLWAGMILCSIVFAALTGRVPEITDALLESSQEAISLCITMFGIMSFWVGIMEIALQSGVIHSLSRIARPVLRRLFPLIPEDHSALESMTVNMISNILGLGWAATPAGLKAMKALEDLEEGRRLGICPGPPRKKGTASNEMCDFLIINISSLQLIPINIIAYRSQYGSVAPAAIVSAGIIATTISTLAGIIYCKAFRHS